MRVDSKLKTQNSKLQKLISLLLDWFTANARDLPWRRTREPYAVWVSEIMLQQTQVKTVIPYWRRWLRALPTIKDVAAARSEKIHKLWEGLGYYARARNLQKAAQQIMEKHGGRFPQNFDDVLALPGIGRCTAGAICSIAFDQPVPVLDGNVIRVLTRIFGISQNPREKKTNARLWELAEKFAAQAARFRPRAPGLTPRASFFKSRTRTKDQPTHKATARQSEDEDDSAVSRFNQSLMELGALVCTPRRPKCLECPARKSCIAFQQNRVEELPNLGKRAASTVRHFIAFVLERNGRFLVRQRPAGVVNAHLWEFPNVEIPDGKTNSQRAVKSLFSITLRNTRHFCTIKHSITRHRITLEAFHTRLGGRSYPTPKTFRARGARPSENSGVWKTPAQMQTLAFSSAHKKILMALPTQVR
jgi:A/G-specific adenine glycosylase